MFEKTENKLNTGRGWHIKKQINKGNLTKEIWCKSL